MSFYLIIYESDRYRSCRGMENVLHVCDNDVDRMVTGQSLKPHNYRRTCHTVRLMGMLRSQWWSIFPVIHSGSSLLVTLASLSWINNKEHEKWMAGSLRRQSADGTPPIRGSGGEMRRRRMHVARESYEALLGHKTGMCSRVCKKNTHCHKQLSFICV